MRKKLLLLFLIFIFALSAFANIYEVIPQNSKAVVVLNNTKTVYNDLKTVPFFGKILDDPIYAETLITGMIDAYIQSLEMDSEEVYAGLENNLGLFIIEPEENNYDIGIAFGPLDDGKKYIDIFSKVIDALMPETEENMNFSYIVKKSDLQDYLIITTNKDAYENSRLNFIPQKRYNDTGIYEEINTSSIKGYGFSNIKDGYLHSKFYLLTDTEISPSSVDVDNAEFFGLYFSKTNYIPKNLSLNLSSFGMELPEDLISNLLEKSEWAEQTGTINIKTDEETGEIVSNLGMRIKIKTNSTFEEITKLIPDDISKESLGKNYLKISKNIEDENLLLYLWKDGDFLFLSNLDKNELKNYENSAKNLSSNALYNDLKPKVPQGNIGIFFIDLKPIVSFLIDYLGGEGLDGEFGGLGTAISAKTPDGKNVIEFNFVMK